MKPSTKATLILIAVVLAAFRIGGEKGQVLQAAAHLFLGGACLAWYQADMAKLPLLKRVLIVLDALFRPWRYSFAAQLVVVLSIIEVACFVASGGQLKP